MAVHGLNDLEVSGCALSVDWSKPLCFQGYCMCVKHGPSEKQKEPRSTLFKFWCWRRILHIQRTHMVTNESCEIIKPIRGHDGSHEVAVGPTS